MASPHYSARCQDGKIYRTYNANDAYQWHTSGLMVIIGGTEDVVLTKGQQKVSLPCRDLKFERIARYIRKGYFDDSTKSGYIVEWTSSTSPTTQVRLGPLDSLGALEQLKNKEIIHLPEKTLHAIKRQNRRKKDLKKLPKTVMPIKHDMARLEAYAQDKGIVGKPTLLYHGTSAHNVESIVEKGFVLWGAGGHGAMLGRGVYLGPLSKAQNYSNGLILVVQVYLGNCKELTKLEDINAWENRGYDSMHLPKGEYAGAFNGTVRNEEWIIRDPQLTEVVGIVIKNPHNRRW